MDGPGQAGGPEDLPELCELAKNQAESKVGDKCKNPTTPANIECKISGKSSFGPGAYCEVICTYVCVGAGLESSPGEMIKPSNSTILDFKKLIDPINS